MYRGFDEEIVAFTQDDVEVEALGLVSSDQNEPTSDDEGDDLPMLDKLSRESMYVTMFSDMLDVVLTHESYLFSPDELNVFNRYRGLSQPARFLLVRLALRKGGKWHRSDLLRTVYQNDVPDIDEAIKEICLLLCEKESSSSIQPPRGQQQRTEMITVKNKEVECICISDDESEEEPTPELDDGLEHLARDDGYASIQDILGTLKSPELKELAKQLKCGIIGLKRAGIIQAIIQTTQKQSILPNWQKDLPSRAGDSSSKQGHQLTLAAFVQRKPSINRKSRSYQTIRLKEMVMKKTGPCVRLNTGFLKLLHRVNLVFFRSTTPTTTLLPLILTHTKASNPSHRNYPRYTATRSISIFRSRAELLAYEHALNVEKEIDDAMDQSPRPEGAEKAMLLFEQIYERWKEVVQEEGSSEGGSHKRTGVLVRFEEGHVLTRIVYKGARACGILKKFELELEILTNLLGQRLWRQGLRGQWYERKALILMTHCERSVENAQLAREVVKEGLDDPSTHLIYHPALERRLARLEKKLKIPDDERHLAGQVLRPAEYLLIRGPRIFRPIEPTPAPSLIANYRSVSRSASLATVEDKKFKTPKTPGPSKRNRASMSLTPEGTSLPINEGLTNLKTPTSAIRDKGKGKENAGSVSIIRNRMQADKTKKGKSVWKGKEGEVNVEQFVLEHYETKGYKGFHAEGRIVTHLFCLLFWSILFDDTVEGAFETCYQSAPLDLSHDTFYPARRRTIDKRLEDIEKDMGRMLGLIKEVDERERPRKTWAQGARWDMFELQDTLEIAEGLGGKTLSVICKLLCEEYGKRASGVPDLIIWNTATKDAHFVEVKGPGDTLQENQKVWIDVLVGCGAKVEVCRVENLDYKSPVRKQRKGSSKMRKPKARKDRTPSQEIESEDDENDARPVWKTEHDDDYVAKIPSPLEAGSSKKRSSTSEWANTPNPSPTKKRQRVDPCT